MRIKNLFSVPEGQKVTEKVFGRVLISSLCSILLCMTCLVSATWAWYSVSLENPGNEINIGAPAVAVKVNNLDFASGTELESGTYQVTITHAGEADYFENKSTLYVTLTLGSTNTVCQLNAENAYQQAFVLEIGAGKQCGFAWEATWFAPGGNTESLNGGTLTIEDVVEEQPSVDTTVADVNGTTGETTAPAEVTTGETTAPAEEVTTGETTAPAEVTTGETTAPAEEVTTGETTAPVEETTTAATDAPEEETTTDETTAPAEENS